MKNKIIKLARILLPKKIYRLIRIKPRLIFVSDSLYQKIKNINKASWINDFDNRGDNNSYLLKYAHMLDKGLQRLDKKPGHSFPLVSKINSLLIDKGKTHNIKHVKWAQNMLKHHEDLQNGNFLYSKEFKFKNQSSLDIKSLSSHIIERRSVRNFEESSPSIEDIMPALKLLPWAPSSCNRQTIHVFLTDDPIKVKICTKQNKGATGLSGNYIFLSVTFDSRSYHLPQESLTGYIDTSLAFQNFIIAIHSLDLAATVLNWSHADKNENKNLREVLSISNDYEIVMNCIVGKPRQGAPTPSKKNINELISIK